MFKQSNSSYKQKWTAASYASFNKFYCNMSLGFCLKDTLKENASWNETFESINQRRIQGDEQVAQHP